MHHLSPRYYRRTRSANVLATQPAVLGLEMQRIRALGSIDVLVLSLVVVLLPLRSLLPLLLLLSQCTSQLTMLGVAQFR